MLSTVTQRYDVVEAFVSQGDGSLAEVTNTTVALRNLFIGDGFNRHTIGPSPLEGVLLLVAPCADDTESRKRIAADAESGPRLHLLTTRAPLRVSTMFDIVEGN
jgi:hypothetical protein